MNLANILRGRIAAGQFENAARIDTDPAFHCVMVHPSGSIVLRVRQLVGHAVAGGKACLGFVLSRTTRLAKGFHQRAIAAPHLYGDDLAICAELYPRRQLWSAFTAV